MLRLHSLLVLVASVSAACVGPEVNQATIDLVQGFESFEPDICRFEREKKGKENLVADDFQTPTQQATQRLGTVTCVPIALAQRCLIQSPFPMQMEKSS